MSGTTYTEIRCDFCPAVTRTCDHAEGWASFELSSTPGAEVGEHFDLCPAHGGLTVEQLLKEVAKRKEGEAKRWYEPPADRPTKRR